MADFKLTLEPAEKLTVVGPFAQMTKAELKITNPADGARCAWKVKCTDNALFRIRPVVGVLKPGESATCAIGCSPMPDGAKPTKQHHVVVCSIPAKDGAARSVWTANKEPEASKRLQVEFQDDAAKSAPKSAAKEADETAQPPEGEGAAPADAAAEGEGAAAEEVAA